MKSHFSCKPDQTKRQEGGIRLPSGSQREYAIFVKRTAGQANSYQRPFQLTFAQAREIIEMTVLGSLAKRFHAVQMAAGLHAAILGNILKLHSF